MTANQCTPRSGENVSEAQSNEGAGLVDIGSASAWVDLELFNIQDEPDVDVRADRLDGETSYVELTAHVGNGGKVLISLTVDEAEQLAAKINSAASFARGETDE